MQIGVLIPLIHVIVTIIKNKISIVLGVTIQTILVVAIRTYLNTTKIKERIK